MFKYSSILIFFTLVLFMDVVSAGAARTSGRWNNCVMPYEFDAALPASTEARALWAINHINNATATTGVQIVAYDSNVHGSDRVRFVPNNSCSSYVGRIGGLQNISLSTGCSQGQIVHELLHAFGLYNEHTRPDRDKFVTVNIANVSSGNESKFSVVNGALSLGPYDYGSIMHYGTHNYSINGQPTITAPQSIGQRSGLSMSDILSLKGIYSASNIVPVAGNDVYTVSGGALTANNGGWTDATQSVLYNDGDYDGDSISALIVTDVINGVLNFNNDGTFFYVADNTLALSGGSDSFTYRVFDGLVHSNTATVTLSVNAFTPPANSSINLSDTTISASTVATVDFQVSAGKVFASTGTLAIQFPAGFDISSVGPSAVSSSNNSVDGSFSVMVSGQTVLITRSGGSTLIPGNYQLQINNVINPDMSGVTGSFLLTRTNDSDISTAAGVEIFDPEVPGFFVIPLNNNKTIIVPE